MTVQGLCGTPERIRTSYLLLRRQKVHSALSNTCMPSVDTTWTEFGISHPAAAVFMGTTLFFPDFSLAAVMILSERRSSTSETRWLGTCV